MTCCEAGSSIVDVLEGDALLAHLVRPWVVRAFNVERNAAAR
jgi:hypothetical protein